MALSKIQLVCPTNFNYKSRTTWLSVLVLFLLLGVGSGYWLLWREAYFGQIPYKVKSAQQDWEHYEKYVKPNGRLLSTAPWGLHLDSGERVIRHFAVANEDQFLPKRFGIEMKSIGRLPIRSKDGSHLRAPPVPNVHKRAVAKLVAAGSVYDEATDGATTSCFIFELGPRQIAEIPVLAYAPGTRGISAITYAVLLKEGQDMNCQAATNQNDQLRYTGLLQPDTGQELTRDELPVSVGRLE